MFVKERLSLFICRVADCAGKLCQVLIALYLANSFAKNYENQTMLVRVSAKNVR